IGGGAPRRAPHAPGFRARGGLDGGPAPRRLAAPSRRSGGAVAALALARAPDRRPARDLRGSLRAARRALGGESLGARALLRPGLRAARDLRRRFRGRETGAFEGRRLEGDETVTRRRAFPVLAMAALALIASAGCERRVTLATRGGDSTQIAQPDSLA